MKSRRAPFRRDGRVGLVQSIAVGGLAGAAGTAAMDALWYRRARCGGTTEGPLAWEFATATTRWSDVSAPGKVGRLVLEKLTHGLPPESWARPTQNIVHWATGIAWGIQFGAALRLMDRPRWWWGLGLGVIAWSASYAVLGMLGVYKPIWDYDADTLTQDLSAHLVYGATASVTHSVVRRVARGAA